MTDPTTSESPELTIATTIDDTWVAHFATCAASIAASRGPERIRFLMLQGPSLTDVALASVRDFVRDLGMELDAVQVPDESLATLPPTNLFSPLVWFRLLLPDLLPDHSRVLALDADTLVLQSLRSLYEVSFDSSPLCAVAQPMTGGADRIRSLGIDPAQSYFNAGVMMMDLDAMREEQLGRRAIELGHERVADFVFAEQDALNVLVTKRWKRLSPKWNAMSYLWLLHEVADRGYTELELTSARCSPAIVHFEGFQTVKPWYYRSVHPLRGLYRDFRRQTPWPLHQLERRTPSGVVLRPLPIRWQYAIARAKAAAAQRVLRG